MAKLNMEVRKDGKWQWQRYRMGNQHPHQLAGYYDGWVRGYADYYRPLGLWRVWLSPGNGTVVQAKGYHTEEQVVAIIMAAHALEANKF
jgi:hypothetical protein